MRVKNRKSIRRLSFRSLQASSKRNLIAILAIILTTLLFTSLFTVTLSLNATYETYTFRQMGGYCHGTFKDVTPEQAEKISGHKKIKESGLRSVIGFCDSGVFAKVPGEVSFMDNNCMKWSYATPTTGRMPREKNEIAMDTRALQRLGIKPEIGAKVELNYRVEDKEQAKQFERTDTFRLCGYWEYDEIAPVHYLNISESYAAEIEKLAVAEGMEPFRKDLNVMLASSMNIESVMKQVDTDLGYQWENSEQADCVRIGVNWGYTSSQTISEMDPGMIATIAALLVLIILTGYLIIYNIFRISVVGDIRFYGLLKTIGTTSRQLKRIIRQQALLLCIVGIPVGILGGYGIGAVLTPTVIASTTLGENCTTVSASPLIFAGAALFALFTVLLSCARPGRLAAKVSPVEATKYTEVNRIKKTKRATRGANVRKMAFANLGRGKLKTGLVMISLCLAVVLLNMLYLFVDGFDTEEYLRRQTCADFTVGTTDYFRYRAQSGESGLKEEILQEIKRNTKQSTGGGIYDIDSNLDSWAPMSEGLYRQQCSQVMPQEQIEAILKQKEQKDGKLSEPIRIEGLDPALLEKLTVLEGDLAPLSDPEKKAIAIVVSVDDYGNPVHLETYPKVGDSLPVTYVEEGVYLDSRTGELCDENTPEEYVEFRREKSHKVEYTVCALVDLPYSMSFRGGVLPSQNAVMLTEKLRQDSRMELYMPAYLFDTPDRKAEDAAEQYLAGLTKGDLSPIMYESKALLREDFEGFQKLFLLLGGLLCFIIGLVGVLNFFNAIMMGILSRNREFAVLQAIGMTRKQLKSMLIWEGLFYAFGAVILSTVLTLILSPLAGNLMADMFFFFEYGGFPSLPLLSSVVAFAALGILIPLILYSSTAKTSAIERLRETE